MPLDAYGKLYICPDCGRISGCKCYMDLRPLCTYCATAMACGNHDNPCNCGCHNHSFVDNA